MPASAVLSEGPIHMTSPLPILLYHRIDEDGGLLSTKASVFLQHMQYLHEGGWRSLTLDEFSSYAETGTELPPKSFLLSFDDGYQSLLTEAAPVLKSFNYTASCFLCTQFVRDPYRPIDLQGVDNNCYLSWDDARRLQSDGLMEFQSHSHTHQKFSGCTANQLAHDLDAAQRMLSSELKLPRSYFRHLSWPFGESTQEWRRLAADCGLDFQYTVSRQAFYKGSDPHNIPRTCYDRTSIRRFKTQHWLQTGAVRKIWHMTYPALRRVLLPPPAQLALVTPQTIDASGRDPKEDDPHSHTSETSSAHAKVRPMKIDPRTEK